MVEMQRVFDRSATGLEAGRELLRLHPGHNTVSDFAIDFQTLAADSGWEGRSLVDAFLHGLEEPVKHKMLTRDLPEDLERITALMIRVDPFVYLDDILIFSQGAQSHQGHIRRVLQRLLENRLFVKAEKCIFSCTSTTFLSYVISAGSIAMDPEKVHAVEQWPQPGDRKSLQRFLWFANFYRRFIRGYSSVAAPLTRLTSTKVRFTWGPEAEGAFQTLKGKFTSAPILVHPDPERQFIVEVPPTLG